MVVIDRSIDNTPAVLRWAAKSDNNRVPVGVDVATAEALASSMLNRIGFSLGYKVVEKFDDLEDEIKDQIQAGDGNSGNAKGVYHGGVIYLVVESLAMTCPRN